MAWNLTHFIVLEDFEVPQSSGKGQKILTGTLLKCTDDNVQKRALLLESLDSNNKSLHFTYMRNGNIIKQIENEYVDYLLAITNLRKRSNALSDKHKLKGALEVKVGDMVQVTTGDVLADAILRYKGKLDGNGILFGVELLSHRGLGATDGVFCKKQYFKCDDNCGMFVPFDKLTFGGSSASPESVKAVLDQFKIGMRVSFDNSQIDGKEQHIPGVLKYLFPHENTETTLAGIEVDDYVPGLDYTGCFKGRSYFSPQPNVTILPLEYVIPSALIEGEKSNKPKFFDQIKSMFTSDSKNEGSRNENTSPPSSWEFVGAGRGSRGKSRIQTEEVQPVTIIEDDLLRKIAMILKDHWYIMGTKLKVKNKKLEHISRNSSYLEEKAFQMLKIWQAENVNVTDKLGVLARTCKEINKEDLCNELFQGVDDDILEFVAQEAYCKWDILAEKLNASNIIDRIHKKQRADYKAMCLEVLFIWRTNQPAVSDKVVFLASILYQIDLGHAATFLTQGLDDEFLQQLSVGLASSWQTVAVDLGMTNQEIKDIEYGRITDKSKQAYHAFMKWKKRQPSHVDKLGVLAAALKKSGNDEFANHLLGGLENGAIHKIVLGLRKIPVDRQTLCTALNFKESHLTYFKWKFSTDFAGMKAMLLAWRAQQDRTKDKKQELITLLSRCGFTSILKDVFPENDQADEMDVDYAGDSYVSDEIITIISETLVEIDVTALTTYFKLSKSSSSTQHPTDFKSEALALLKYLRKVHQSEFKSVLAEALDIISRKDLADLLKEEPKSDGSGTKPKQDSKPNSLVVSRPPPELQHQFSVGSMVEIQVAGIPMYGVIKWIGDIPQMKEKGEIAGIELEMDCMAATDGTFADRRYFQTAPRRALFIPILKCKPDARFSRSMEDFGKENTPVFTFTSPSVTEITLPPMMARPHPYDALGIQGDQNSCYLDSTIFSMFAFVDVFDDLLHRPRKENDLAQYTEVQRVLKEDIVYPLRRNGIVKAGSIKRLRELLDALGTTVGLRDQEKDPEEFLTTLLQEVLKSDPLFKIRVHGTTSVQEMNFYQMFMERDNTLKHTPEVQTLLEQSFLNTDIKLTEIPSCFVVQMPRFGKAYKLYNRILPTLYLDITHMLENFPRPCVVCGRLSTLECRDCSSAKLGDEQITAYCQSCYERIHKKQTHGNPRPLNVPEHFPQNDEEEERKALHSEIMELFAVVCIETSHYVAFVKDGKLSESQWLFFDSMADRIGDYDGFNIPKIKILPNFQSWIDNPKQYENISDRELEDPLRRLLCDAYMCFYRSTTEMDCMAASDGTFADTPFTSSKENFEKIKSSVSEELETGNRRASGIQGIEGPLKDMELLGICNALGKNWKNLAYYLGFTKTELDVIESDNFQIGLKDAMMEMLVKWRNRQPSGINQKDVMNAVLKQAGYVRIADELSGNTSNSGVLHDNDLLSVSDGLGTNWARFGICLGFEWRTTQLLKAEHKNCGPNACMDMLTKWKQRQSCEIDQVDAMCKLLQQHGFPAVADQLRRHVHPEGFLNDADLASISYNIGADWEKVAVYLDIEWNLVESFREECEGHEFRASMNMLTTWRTRRPSNINQLDVMCKVLNHPEVGCNEVAEQLRKKYASS